MSAHQTNKDKPRSSKCRHFCFAFDSHNYCPTCRESGKGDVPCVTFESPCEICASFTEEQLIKTRPLQWYDLPPGRKNVLFKVSFTSQTSGSNNKLDIGTFKLGHPRLTNSKTNNKRDIDTFKFGHRRLTLNEGPKVKSDHIKRFPAYLFL